MSTFIAEPGTRLGGRYRLEDRVSASSGWSIWKAHDETLARSVSVLTFAAGFPRVEAVVTAARATSRLTDPRVAQVFDVFDVEEGWEQAYVVMEWVGGDCLDDLLADGPLEPARGAEIISQAAEALAGAHAAGVAHLCLTPGSLHWTAGGGVKITGVGIDAALTGAAAEDPALTDTRGLGMLLYAALTARWPGTGWPGLPPVLEVDGQTPSPRQVRAGVPQSLDEITRRALFPSDGASTATITSPATLATALAKVVPAAPVPPAPQRGGSGRRSQPAAPQPTQAVNWELPDVSTDYWDANTARRAPSRHRGLATVVGLLVLAALGVGGWMITSHEFGGGTPPKPSHTAAATLHAQVLTPVSANAFGPGGGDNENLASQAIAGKPGDQWTTDHYSGSPFFGNLYVKDGPRYNGTGLLLDMGKNVRVSSVRVVFGATPGADAQIQIGDSDSGFPPTGYTTVASKNDVGGPVTFHLRDAPSGRFVLIWFSKLAPLPGSGGEFQADVADVTVRGSA